MNQPTSLRSGASMFAFIDALLQFPGRVAGSEGERTCQEAIAGRLHALGFDAVVEGAVGPPPVYWVLALHAGAGLLSLAMTTTWPAPALLLGLVVAASFRGELRGRPRLLRPLLVRQMTGNLVARRPQPGSRARLLLVAHADVASSSALFRPWAARWLRDRDPGTWAHPGFLVLAAALGQCLLAAAAWLRDRPAWWPGLAACGLVYLGLAVVAWDWRRSPPVPGANDNASGLAVVCSVAESLSERPLRNAELWVVVTGDREPEAGGMAAFCRQFGHLLGPDDTWVLNVDEVGSGQLCVGLAEQAGERLAYRPTLPALAEELAHTAAFASLRLVELRGRTDAGPATEAGWRAATITALHAGRRPSNLHTAHDDLRGVDPRALERARDLTLALCRRVDDWLADEPGPGAR